MNANKKITSIEIENTFFALCSVYEITREILKIYRIGKIKHYQYNGIFNHPFSEYNYKVNASEMDEFFKFLIIEIKVQSWNDDYSVEVCDGCSWECKIRYSDNTVKKITGTVEPPPRGNQLKNWIYKLAAFQVEPWIF